MFDFLRRGAGPTQKQIGRAVSRLTQSHGEEGPRLEAADRLVEWGTPEALFGLLMRFTMSSRVIAQDIDEKRMIVDMLVRQGGAAVEPILRFMKTHHQVDWPVQALAQMVSEGELVRHLVDTIDAVAQSEFAAPVHRVSLIRAVQGHVTEEMIPTLEGFLEDSDDDVRLVAIQSLAELGEPVREKLIEAFLAADDRLRIRREIAELFAEHAWPVKGYRPRVEESLPDGFTLNAKGVVRQR